MDTVSNYKVINRIIKNDYMRPGPNDCLEQVWRMYGTRARGGTYKISLARGTFKFDNRY